MSAKKANLSGELKKYFGFSTFKGQQEQIIGNLLNGEDIFVLMPTGVVNHYVISFLLLFRKARR